MLGYDPEDMMDSSSFPKAVRETLRAKVGGMIEGDTQATQRLRIKLPHRNGGRRILECVVKRCPDDCGGLVLTARNITEKARIEGRLREMVSALNSSLDGIAT